MKDYPKIGGRPPEHGSTLSQLKGPNGGQSGNRDAGSTPVVAGNISLQQTISPPVAVAGARLLQAIVEIGEFEEKIPRRAPTNTSETFAQHKFLNR
jgi:hypothetical protein